MTTPPKLTLSVLACAAALAAAPPASALRLVGNVHSYHRAWVAEARPYVPLSRLTVWIGRGDPTFYPADPSAGDPAEIYLPGVGQGWTYADNRALLYHELGHALDDADMTAPDRATFRRMVGTTCSWRAEHCYSVSWRSGQVIDLPPIEMFAEMYGACAYDESKADLDDSGVVSYGWYPPRGTDAALCRFIRSMPLRPRLREATPAPPLARGATS